jgi:DNA-binding response OmpR family regulator
LATITPPSENLELCYEQLDKEIRLLRRKLGYTAGSTGSIISVRGVGYRLAP